MANIFTRMLLIVCLYPGIIRNIEPEPSRSLAVSPLLEPCLFTSFDGRRHLASGTLPTVALATKRALERGAAGPVLIFDNRTGRSIDVDTRGADDEIRARLADQPGAGGMPVAEPDTESAAHRQEDAAPRGRGRPKLGVIAREVTLLPRHWDWLGAQPGGASVALRRLVDEARRTHTQRDARRLAHERAYHFMSAMAGDFPGFEEATRALFADEASGFAMRVADWPADIRRHVEWLGFGDVTQPTPAAAPLPAVAIARG
jgi:uncharacterized protein